MAISSVLEVAIGLTFIYVLLSVLCSGLNEWIAQTRGRRGRFLREGLRNLLGDRWFYLRLVNHPLLSAYRRDVAGKAQKPSYLPSEAVAQALFDVLVVKANHLHPQNKIPRSNASLDFEQVRDAAAKCQEEGYAIGAAVLPLLDQADKDLAAASKAVAAWYDSAMERVTGWYKRNARNSLFLIGAVVAVVLNVDSIEITRTLMRSDSLREAVVQEALAASATGKIGGVQIVRDGVPVTPSPDDIKALVAAGEQLEAKGLPIGFSCLAPALDPKAGSDTAGISALVKECVKAAKDTSGGTVILKVIGWLITALALTLGAPFWFQLLNRLVDVRGAGTKPLPASGKDGKGDGAATA